MAKCPVCDGTGKIVHPMMSMNGDEYTGEWEQHECEACDGTGYVTACVYESDEIGFVDKSYECAVCHGTGHIEQTEQEYIQSCNHKELTEILFRMIVHGSVVRPDRQYISEWLKQPHANE